MTTTPLRVLVVDDVPMNRKLLRAQLEGEGHTVIDATNGEEALGVLERMETDLIISDILMPVMDGYRLCYEVRHDSRFQKLPFIAYTASYLSDSDEKLSRDLGADVYLRKPASLPDLRRSIEGALANPGQLPITTNDTIDVLKEYSERLVSKLEKRNRELHDVRESTRVQGTALNIAVAVRKKSERKLREANEQLLDLLQHSPAVTYAMTVNGESVTLRVVSENVTRILGFSIEDTLTVDWWLEHVHPEDRALAEARIQQTMTQGVSRTEYRLRHLDGSYRWIDDNQRRVALSPDLVAGVWTDITDRRTAESAHQKSEAWLSAFFEASRDGILVEDDGIIVLINTSYANMLGYYPNELLGKPISIIAAPEDLPRLLSYGAARQRGESPPSIYEFRGLREDGSSIHLEAAVSMTVIDGKAFITTAARDITERKHAAHALKRSEREQRQLAEQLELEKSRLVEAQALAKVGSWITDLKTGAVEWSEETRRIFERPYGAITIEVVLSLVHPDDRQQVNEAFRGSLRDKKSRCIEHRLLLPNGRIKYVEERWQLELDEHFDGSRAIGTCQDITDRKLSDLAAEQAQERLRGIYDGLGPSMFVALLTPSGVVLEINKSPLDAVGLTADDVLGKQFVDTHWWSDSPEARLQLREALSRAANGHASRYDVRVKGSEAKVSDLDFSLCPLRNEKGDVEFLVCSASVITERKVAEAALRHGQKMEAVGQLAAGVAHEFNNILQTIMAKATAVRLMAEKPEIAMIAAQMEAQVRRGASVTSQLLLSSRDQELTTKSFDAREQVTTARDLLRPLIPENINLAVEIPPNRCEAEGDVGQIQQVLLNLVINARDAMPDGGTITLRVASGNGEISLEVEDDGSGFDDSTRERIFEPFFTTKDVGKGTGLGLAVVYGIIEQHHGRIEVHSQPGHGSRFRIVLPQTFAEVATHVAAPVEDVMKATGRILLVEDEAGVREGLALLMEMIGYEVIAVSKAEEALALPSSPVPDMLLTDVALPGISGPTLAGQLRKRWPSLIVTLMTGYADAGTREMSRDQGWTILQKPFEMDELLKHLSAALESPWEEQKRSMVS